MPSTQEYSVTRTRAAFKPRVSGEDLAFFEDAAGNMALGLSGEAGVELTGSGSTEVRHLPYAQLNALDEDAPVERAGAHAGAPLPLVAEADLPEGVSIDYRIDGGFNNNCIIVTWDDDAEHRLVWACLKTFTGIQMKYAVPKKRNRMVFALADEDAFAYCNKQPCVECGFRCKSGFVLYALVRGVGIVRKPVERISMLGIIGDGGLEAGTLDHRS